MKKLVKKIEAFKDSFIGIILWSSSSLIAGLLLFFYPEEAPRIAIQILGIAWILEGIVYFSELLSENGNQTDSEEQTNTSVP